jgi:hypothetical protein
MVMMLVPARMTPFERELGRVAVRRELAAGVRLLGFAIGAVMRRRGLTPAR